MFEQATQRGPAPAELYAEARWYACYTRARHEKQVEKLLQQRGIDSYLPTLRRERQWKDRRKQVEFPLFPSYVFGRFTLGQIHDVLTTPGVSTIVRTRGYPTPIREHELENVRLFAQALERTGLEPAPRPLPREGDRVRVTDGPFRGVEGLVLETRGRKRVLVGLQAIGQGLEVDIGADVLELIPRGR